MNSGCDSRARRRHGSPGTEVTKETIGEVANGNPRTKESPIDTNVFAGEVRFDTVYHYSFNHPRDHTICGSSEVFRSDEVQVTQVGVGGGFHWNNVRGRLIDDAVWHVLADDPA